MSLKTASVPIAADTGAALSAVAWVSPNAAVIAADDQHLYELHVQSEPLRAHHLTPMPLPSPVIALAAFPLAAIADRISNVGTGQECSSMLAAALANGTLQLYKLKLSEGLNGGAGVGANGGGNTGTGAGNGGSSGGRTVKISGVKTIQKALNSPVSALCWMADASALVVGCEDGSLIVFSPSGEPRAQFSGLKGSAIRTLASSRGDSLIIGTSVGLYSFQLSSAQSPVLLNPGSISAVSIIEETNSMLVAHDDGAIHCIGPSGNLVWVSSLSGIMGNGSGNIMGNLGASGIAAGMGGMSGVGAEGSLVGDGRGFGSMNEVSDTPTTITVSHDGNYALIGSLEGRISLMSLYNPIIIDELRFDAGGILSLNFAPGGNVAIATTLCNKAIIIYSYGQRSCSCTCETYLSSPTTLEIWDETTNPPVHEEIETGSAVSTVKVGYGHIVALTKSLIYSIEQPSEGTFQSGSMLKIGTTSVMPVGESAGIGIDVGAGLTPPPIIISMGEGSFAVSDAAGILYTYSYDMRSLGKIKHNSSYSSRSIAINGGVVACVDVKSPYIVNLFTTSGKKVGGSGGLKHIRPISKVVIGHSSNIYSGSLGSGNSRRQRLVVVLDVFNEVWAYEVSPSDIGQGCRLGLSGIYDIAFVEGTTALLLVTQDGLALHVCPTASLIDPGLTTTPIFGIKRLASPLSVRIANAEPPKEGKDGYAILQTSLSSYTHCRIPSLPLKALTAKNADELLTICRTEPSTPLWTLAALIGAQVGDLVILKAAYSALSLLTRVRVVTKAQASDNNAEREAFVKVLVGDTENALNILIANNRYKAAIQLCLELFMKERAERIANDSGDQTLINYVKGQQ